MSNALARKIEAIETKGGMKAIDIANILGTRPETVSRWNLGKAFPRPDTEKLLLELEYIVDLLSDLYTPDEARMWLYGRQKLFAGKRPVELIQDDRIDNVIEVLDQMRQNSYV